jgi:hypothetical protein
MEPEERRQVALSLMWQRFPDVADRVSRVYGLRLPRHLAVFCALWQSADAAERQALDFVMVSPFGITEYFGDNGLRLTARDGLDERLHARYRRDPAEFVTVLSGGTDGLHFGLWYDDPADLPSMVVHNYARAEGQTETNHCPTLLAELRSLIQDGIDDYGEDSEETEEVRPLTAALDWFGAAERESLLADGLAITPPAVGSLGGVTLLPSLPPDCGDPRLGESQQRIAAFMADEPAAQTWIARAEHELDRNRPALALAVGAELHWVGRRYERQSRLLVKAYRQLGREALAQIADIHARHRDLRTVDVLSQAGRVPPAE